jgi:hypothetical protein
MSRVDPRTQYQKKMRKDFTLDEVRHALERLAANASREVGYG